MQLIFLCVIYMSVAGIQFLLFHSEIGVGETQSDFLIDALYYIDLGQRIAADFWSGRGSIFEIVIENRPNFSSTGIVYINALLAVLGFKGFFASLFQCAILTLTIALIFKRKALVAGCIILVFSGLSVYILLPSKESFILIGFLLFIGCTSLYPRMLGIFIIALARPEAAFLVMAATLGFWAWYHVGRFVTVLMAFFAYISMRDMIIDYAIFMEILSSSYDNFFCSVGPLNICVSNGQVFEFIVFKRILVTMGLPIKWVWDLTSIFDDQTLSGVVIKITLAFAVLGMLWQGIFLMKFMRNSIAMLRVLWCAIIYMCAFSAPIFYQPSRQFALAWSFILVAILFERYSAKRIHFNEEHHKGSSAMTKNSSARLSSLK